LRHLRANVAQLVNWVDGTIEDVTTRLAGSRWGILLPILLLAALGIPRLVMVAPWSDEAFVAGPAVDLLTNGSMGTRVCAADCCHYGSVAFDGLAERTYWMPPLSFLVTAGWLGVFGTGLFALRAFSMVWGVLGLVSLWFVARSLCDNNKKVAIVTVIVVAMSFIYVRGSADGRLWDVMSVSLSLAAYASYLGWRQSHLARAVLVSSILATGAALTHPLGIVSFMGLAFLAMFYDRSRLRVRHFAIWVLPPVVGLAGWGCYIMRDFDLFMAQFFGNTAAVEGMGFTWQTIVAEFTQRYGFKPYVTSHDTLTFGILLCAMGAGAFLSWRQRMLRPVVVLCIIPFLVLLFLVGHKLSRHLMHILPLLVLLLVCQWHIARTRPLINVAVSFLLVVLVAVSLNTLVYDIQNRAEYSEYAQAMEYVSVHSVETDTVCGDSANAFGLGFRPNVFHDLALTCEAVSADFFVIAPGTRDYLAANRPGGYAALQDVLSSGEFVLVYSSGGYEVYERRE